MSGKLIIFSAPSGSGKSTLVKYLLDCGFKFSFSVSATSRTPRGEERNGVDYWFLSPEEFRSKIANNEFVEYEEVYENCFYGTLRSEVDDRLARGENVLFDVDVVGGVNIKKLYAGRALSLFIQPPSVEELRRRLIGRATDSVEMIEKRVRKAEWEMSFADKFDAVIVNGDLDVAKQRLVAVVQDFLKA